MVKLFSSFKEGPVAQWIKHQADYRLRDKNVSLSGRHKDPIYLLIIKILIPGLFQFFEVLWAK